MLLAQPVGALDHEAHDLVRRVDDAQPVGCLRVVDLVEILVDGLQKFLLLVMAADLRGGALDRRIVRLAAPRSVLFFTLPVKNVSSSP